MDYKTQVYAVEVDGELVRCDAVITNSEGDWAAVWNGESADHVTDSGDYVEAPDGWRIAIIAQDKPKVAIVAYETYTGTHEAGKNQSLKGGKLALWGDTYNYCHGYDALIEKIAPSRAKVKASWHHSLNEIRAYRITDIKKLEAWVKRFYPELV